MEPYSFPLLRRSRSRVKRGLQLADPVGSDWQAIWGEEWQANLLHTALERFKRRVQPEHYESYYLHVTLPDGSA
jgi:hypothetical protein